MKEKNKVGMPSAYRKEYCIQVEKLCKLGATDKEIADFFEVSVDTVYEWKKVHPEFSESIKNGKEIADAEVASKLFHRATGYEHEEDDIRAVNGEIVITPTIKHYPPDTTAAIFWLKNRQKDKWRDRQEVTGADGAPLMPPTTIKLVSGSNDNSNDSTTSETDTSL